MKSIWLSTILLSVFVLLHAEYAHANYLKSVNNQINIFEISDKYDEVKLGMTDRTVYMIFTDGAREMVNREFEEEYKIASQAFFDSEGNFIIGEALSLNSNFLSVPITDIEYIEFKNGKLLFHYSSQTKIGFEDVKTHQGVDALDNFYVEDLEHFILMFNKNKN